ncbi:MAG TPA: ATP-binding protein [Longimicrobiales bacterium]|nr:ATP-binding protein [Longimicrobiales bacterium]
MAEARRRAGREHPSGSRPDSGQALHGDEDREQARRMESLARLAGGVAHDFNNMLTAIKGCVSFALEDLPADHPVRPDLEQVVVASDRATELTRKLQLFSRGQPARPAVHDLGELVRRAEPALRRLLRDDIELRIDAAAETVPVRVDPVQVEQVVVQLVQNACDAMPDGGSVEMTVDEVRLDDDEAAALGPAVRPGSWARIAVTDTGPGIPPEARPHVFEPFYSTKESGIGIGLGLAVVYGIVRQAGGHVFIDEREGTGARVVVHLPRSDAESGSPAPLTSEGSAG